MVIKKIRRMIKRYHPHAAKKVERHLKFRYPKLFMLLIFTFLAYYLFSQPAISKNIPNLNEFNYLGSFIAGVFFALGFTAPFSLGFFITSQPDNIFLAALVGSLGAVLANLIIFRMIRSSFIREFDEIKRTKTAKKIDKLVKNNISVKIRHYLLYIFAGILIATPLPDEIGISMLAGLTTIKPKILGVISFILHYFGILIIFFLAA